MKKSILLLMLLATVLTALAQPPTITSFSPTSGPAGTTVTITGTSFSPNASDNTVYFGAVKASVVNASSTLLTVTAPAGATYQSISVTVNGLTAYSTQPFVLTFPNNCVGFYDNSFAPKIDYIAETATNSFFMNTVAIGDLDGDGKSDLAVANAKAGTISVFRNNSGNGTTAFTDKKDLAPNAVNPFSPNSHDINSITIADADGDGKPDLAVANTYASSVSVFRNTSSSGNLSFAPAQEFVVGTLPFYKYKCQDCPLGSRPKGTLFSDLDGDGKPDLAVINSLSFSISISKNLSNNGIIAFAPYVEYHTSGGTGYRDNLAIGDLDGDGKPDLAVTNSVSNSVSVLKKLRENGLIEFAPAANYPTGTGPTDVAIGDMDGDGKPDLAIANNSAGTVSILRSQITCPTPCTQPTFLINSNIVVDAGCSGNNGSISIVPLSGTAHFQYSIDNGLTYVAGPVTGYTFNQLSTGMYEVRLKDANGCESAVAQKEVKVNCHPIPVITSFTPASGPIGTTVTLTGTNFSPTSAENTVYFGAVKARVTAASSNSLTVIAPAGATYQPITVTVNGLTSISKLPFAITFSANCIDITSNAFTMPVSTLEASSIGPAGDFDGDGKIDLVVSGKESLQNMQILRNTSSEGSLRFETEDPFATAEDGSSIAAGDMDGDGKLDLVKSSPSSNSITIFSNTSTPGAVSFGAKAEFSAADLPSFGHPKSVAIGDLDRDGKTDIVITYEYTNIISFFKNISNTGNLSFAPRIEFEPESSVQESIEKLTLADIDVDGKPELIFISKPASIFLKEHTVSVLKNTSVNGIISFGKGIEFEVGNDATDIAIGDLDGDGKPDLAIANESSTAVSVFRNASVNGIISLALKTALSTSVWKNRVFINDMNGDGKLDLLITDTYNNPMSIFRNESVSGTIAFARRIDLSGGDIHDLMISDVDSDGKPDLVGVISGRLSVLRNQLSESTCIPPVVSAPIIHSLTPVSGPIGITVTLTGTNFSPTPAENTVYFGAVKARVTAASSNSLTVIAPAGATYQPITVTVNGLTAYANKPFVSTFENKGPDHFVINSFVPTEVLHASDPYGNTIISDLDGDGKSDIVVINIYNQERPVSIFRNWSTIGTILFTYLPDYTIQPVRNATGTPYGFATGDLNGDGKPDLVVMSSAGQNELTGTVSILINTTVNGDISFAETRFHLQGHVAIADMDLDGKPDLILTNGQTTSMYRNTSVGDNVSFAVGLGFDASAVNLAIRDLDGDGKPDLVANDYDSLIILRNTSSQGQIDFAAKTVYNGVGNSAADVAIGDLDGDGKPDLALIDHYAEQVFIRKNTSTSGSISFADHTSFRVGLQPNKVAIADLDGDGKPDLAVANTDANTFSILKNTSVPGTISFAEKVDYSTETGVRPTAIAIGDLDNDGKADLVESNDDIHNSLIVFRNQIGETPHVPTFLDEPTIVLDASCNGNDGLISIIPTSGKLPVLYSIDGGATYVAGPETGYSFQGLAPGLYQLRIKDYFGLESVIITKEVRKFYGGPLFKNDGTIVLDASCGANDGKISIIPNCGAAPFMFSIDGGMTYVSGPATGYTFQGLAPGTYQLRLKDAYGTESAIVTREVRPDMFGPCATVTAASHGTRAAQTRDAPASLQVYPNPTKSKFQVQLSGLPSHQAQVQVLTSQGAVVQQRTLNAEQICVVDIDLTGKAKGLYLIRVISDKATQQTKVLLQ